MRRLEQCHNLDNSNPTLLTRVENSLKASVVIPTYNRSNLLKKCLNAILAQTVPHQDYEVIVVDDFSSDDTQKYMEDISMKHSNVLYIRNTANEGRVVTRNKGIMKASNEIIIFLDNDNEACREFIESHINCHRIHGAEHIAVVGNPRFADEIISTTNFGRFLQARYLGYRSKTEIKKIDLANLSYQYFGGLSSSAQKDDLLRVGLFDSDFRYYGGEDEYLGYCLQKIGVRLVFCEQAKSIHYDDVSLARYKVKFTEAGREGLPLMIKKNPDYKSTTKVGWVLPIDLGKDSFSRIIGKSIICIFFNRTIMKLMETYATKTDNRLNLYFPIIYRLLTAGWLRQGFKSKDRGIGHVTY
jgi:glycosyltransferase involved in cell wall biosynthesis